MKMSSLKKKTKGLERWLGGSELLQSTQVPFPEPISGCSQDPVPGDFMPSSGLHEYLHMDALTQTQTHTNLNITKH